MATPFHIREYVRKAIQAERALAVLDKLLGEGQR